MNLTWETVLDEYNEQAKQTVLNGCTVKVKKVSDGYYFKVTDNQSHMVILNMPWEQDFKSGMVLVNRNTLARRPLALAARKAVWGRITSWSD